MVCVVQVVGGQDLEVGASDSLRTVLVPLLAYYLLGLKDDFGKPFDPVARLHLRNGAKMERINWLADTSDKGMHQSVGLMVNYIYNVSDIEKNHELFANEGHLVASQTLTSLLKQIPDTAQTPAKSDE